MSYQPRHVYDALPSTPDHRDFRMMAVNMASLPSEVMLPVIPILNQSNEGSCVGHGCAGARETLELVANLTLPVVPLSRAFIYYRARLLEGTADQDSGAMVRDGCKVLHDDGVCTEDLFPYTPGKFKDVPPDLDITAAAQYRIITYARLNSSDEIRASLAQSNPVIIGVAVYESFEHQIGPDGRVPIPPPTDTLLGGHCMFLSGYKPDPQNIGMFLFRCQNSWGPNWADSGYCWMPEGYLNNPNLASDLWAISL
jgi:C1A family cysteine protease